eukprot:CAMPEP_0119289936 /NCGR_PEP_ID=MMETSP1329-20130426/39883_1 /TAXON_ID=114041 /ORGANISM="Genus nov. species nov., Strain RCC1024" /LENGTH=215 /DNA_ID=CAMNT_0007290751 /DNA_START=95 /DNA_END=739 /DNA_ORIENTATION=-
MAAQEQAAAQLQWLDSLYGETTAEWRNLIALESKRYMAKALPPKVVMDDLLYGEFRVDDALTIVQRAIKIAMRSGALVDVGSGCARLVLAMARRWPDRRVHGVEFLKPLHDVACKALEQADLENAEVQHGDIHEVAPDALFGAAVAFCYSTAMHSGDDDVAGDLSDALADGLDPGAVAVVTDRKLREEDFELAREDLGCRGSITNATAGDPCDEG